MFKAENPIFKLEKVLLKEFTEYGLQSIQKQSKSACVILRRKF